MKTWWIPIRKQKQIQKIQYIKDIVNKLWVKPRGLGCGFIPHWKNEKNWVLELCLLPLASRNIIVNFVFGFNFWFFTTNWAQLIMAFSKCKAMIWNYLWCGQDYTTRTRVSWANCCPKGEIGGLNLINLKETLDAFMTKYLKPPKGLHDLHTNVDHAYQLSKLIKLIDWVVFDCAL